MQQKITRTEAAKMFSGSGYYFNMFLKKFGIKADDDDMFDRKTLERFKADQRYKNLEMDFFDRRMDLKRSAEIQLTAFCTHAEAVKRLIRKLYFNISEIEATAAVNKLPTWKRNGAPMYFAGDISEVAYKLIMAAPPVKVPLSPDAKKTNKRSKMPASI